MEFVRMFFCITLGFSLAACAPAGKTQNQAPTAKAAEPLIMGQTYTISSDVLGMDRRLTVRLPFYYDKEPERKFPAVYVIDGGLNKTSRILLASLNPAILISPLSRSF